MRRGLDTVGVAICAASILIPMSASAFSLKKAFNKTVHVVTAPARAAATVAKATVNALTKVVAPLPNVVGKVAVAAAPAPVFAYRVIAQHESVSDALKAVATAPGAAVVATAEEVDTATTQQQNLAVTAAGAIAGDPGKTVITVSTGVERVTTEFATTIAIQGGEVLQGQNPAIFVASPLAAALRSAQNEFEADAKPVPDNIKQQLAGAFTAAQLANAKYRVAAISITVPDLVTRTRKAFGEDYGVTTGNVITFAVDPGNNYHWWTHELRHTVQYSEWGIDLFALKYVTNCHGVEGDAESTAQNAFPLPHPNPLGC